MPEVAFAAVVLELFGRQPAMVSASHKFHLQASPYVAELALKPRRACYKILRHHLPRRLGKAWDRTKPKRSLPVPRNQGH